MAGQRGPLLIIGGGEDKTGECRILRRFLELAGGRSARVAVITAASELGEEAGAVYRDVFGRLGAQEVTVLRVADRRDADDPAVAATLERATAVFFTGGDQLRITSTLGGTRLLAALQRAHAEGMALGGTSAGASAMSATMIVGGHGDDTAKRDLLRMSPGLGFLSAAVVDQHFAQRGRITRLLAALSQNPEVLGIGLDEDTGIAVAPDGEAEVVGSGTATFLDGRTVTFTNASESSAVDPLALMDVLVHVLPHGYRFHLGNRRPARPA
jgi:cyanophycinase